MLPAAFEPATPASDRLQTLALDRSAHRTRTTAVTDGQLTHLSHGIIWTLNPIYVISYTKTQFVPQREHRCASIS